MTAAMLAVGKSEAEKQGLCNISFVKGDAEKLPFSNNVSADIYNRLSDEIKGAGAIGFRPYEKNAEIYFNQRWLMIIGKSAAENQI